MAHSTTPSKCNETFFLNTVNASRIKPFYRLSAHAPAAKVDAGPDPPST